MFKRAQNEVDYSFPKISRNSYRKEERKERYNKNLSYGILYKIYIIISGTKHIE